MKPNQWERIAECFETMVDLPQTQQRARIEDLAVSHPHLAKEVASLLDHHREANHSANPLNVDSRSEAGRGDTGGGDSVGGGEAGATSKPTAAFEDSGTNARVINRVLSQSPPPMATTHRRPGEQMGDFQLVRLLGISSQAEVWFAQRTQNLPLPNQDTSFVSLKVWKRNAPWQAVEFSREAALLSRLRHPGIVQLVAQGVSVSGEPWLATVFVDGSSITHFADEHRLTLPQRVALLIQLCDAVHYAHQLQVIHGDIKPDNVIVNSEARPVLLDFGISSIKGEAEDGPGPNPAIRLTPAYAAPEQVAGIPIDERSDVHALTLLLYELISGVSPFSDISDRGTAELLQRIVHQSPAKPSDWFRRRGGSQHRAATADCELRAALRQSTPETLRRQVAGDLDSIVATGLAKTPEQRFQSVGQLQQSLIDWAEARPLAIRRSRHVFWRLLGARPLTTVCIAGGLGGVIGLIVSSIFLVPAWIRSQNETLTIQQHLQRSEQTLKLQQWQQQLTLSDVPDPHEPTLAQQYLTEVTALEGDAPSTGLPRTRMERLILAQQICAANNPRAGLRFAQQMAQQMASESEAMSASELAQWLALCQRLDQAAWALPSLLQFAPDEKTWLSRLEQLDPILQLRLIQSACRCLRDCGWRELAVRTILHFRDPAHSSPELTMLLMSVDAGRRDTRYSQELFQSIGGSTAWSTLALQVDRQDAQIWLCDVLAFDKDPAFAESFSGGFKQDSASEGQWFTVLEQGRSELAIAHFDFGQNRYRKALDICNRVEDSLAASPFQGGGVHLAALRLRMDCAYKLGEPLQYQEAMASAQENAWRKDRQLSQVAWNLLHEWGEQNWDVEENLRLLQRIREVEAAHGGASLLVDSERWATLQRYLLTLKAAMIGNDSSEIQPVLEAISTQEFPLEMLPTTLPAISALAALRCQHTPQLADHSEPAFQEFRSEVKTLIAANPATPVTCWLEYLLTAPHFAKPQGLLAPQKLPPEYWLEMFAMYRQNDVEIQCTMIEGIITENLAEDRQRIETLLQIIGQDDFFPDESEVQRMRQRLIAQTAK